MFFGTAGLTFCLIDLFNCIKQMPYTREKTSNTIEDKNTKSRTYLHCGPQHKTSGQVKTLTEYVIINKIDLKNKIKSVRTEMKRASNC